MPDINIVLKSLGVSDVRADIASVGAEGKQMGADVKKAGDEAKKGLEEVSGGAKEVEKDVRNTAEQVARFRERLESIKGRIEGTVEWGKGLTEGWAEVARSQGNAEARIKATLEAQGRLNDATRQFAIIKEIADKGHFPDFEGLREVTAILDLGKVQTKDLYVLLEGIARLARSSGKDMGELAETFAESYQTGETNPLTEAGLVIPQDTAQKVLEEYAKSAAEGQAMFIRVVGEAIRTSAGKLNNLDPGTARLNDAARAALVFQEALGRGVQMADSNLAGLNARLLIASRVAPETGEKIGAWAEYANVAGQSMVGFIGILANATQVASGWRSLAGGVGTAWAAVVTRLLPLWGSLVTLLGSGLPAAYASMMAAGSAAWTAITVGATTAATATWAFVAANAALIGTLLLVAAAAVAAFYAYDKLTHAKEDAELEENIKKGNVTDPERLRLANEERRKKGKRAITADEWNKMQDPDSGFISPELTLSDEQMGKTTSDSSGMSPDEIKKALAQITAGGASSIPSGGITSTPVTLGAGGALINPGMYGGAGYGPAALYPSGMAGRSAETSARIRSLELQIQGLEEQKEGATKSQQEVIQKQIDERKKQLAGLREQLNADEKATNADLDKKGYAFDVNKARAENRYRDKIEGLESERDKAEKEGDAIRVRALTVRIETLRAQKDRDLALIEASSTALRNEDRAASMRQIAEDNYQSALGRIGRTADKEVDGMKGDTKAHDNAIRAEIAFRGGSYGYRPFGRGGVRGSMGSDGYGNDNDIEVNARIAGQDAKGNLLLTVEPVPLNRFGLQAQRGRRPR